jgi:glycosyltransferase involved in cell wall biosynthesis
MMNNQTTLEAGTPVNPKVSVCIPVYNGKDYISEAIQSVLAQTYRDFELVIVDNASTDGTLELIQRVQDPRLRIERNSSNIGFEGNWNRCLELARGEFVKILPADDLIAPDCLEMQVKVLETHPELALVCSARTIIDLNGRNLASRGMGKKPLFLSSTDVMKRILSAGTNPVGEPGAVLFRSMNIPHAGPFTTKNFYVVDVDYYVRHLAFGGLGYLPSPLAFFRVSAQSSSSVYKDRQYRDFAAWLDDLRQSGNYEFRAGVWISARRRALLNSLARMVFYRFFVKK